MQEAVGHVEGSAAPHLQGEAVPQDVGHAVGALHHVAGTHTGGQQALVGVAHGGVGQQQLLLIQHPLLHGLGALVIQQLLQAGAQRRLGLGEAGDIVLVALGVGVGHLDLGDVPQDAGSAVTGVHDLEQLRRLIDELGMALAVDKGGVGQHVGDEGDVGLDAADAHLIDGAGRLAAHGGEASIPACDLHQQGVIVRGDDGAHAHVAAVQTDAEAAGGVVGGDLAVIGGEVVGGILGGDAALDGVAVEVDILLLRQADLRAAEGIARRHQQLGADDIHAGDHLGDGVLHLDTGVHLDEIVVAGLVHQELHRTGADVVDGLGDLHRVLPQGLHRLLRDGPGGGVLHHLLIPALEGAVTLAQMVDVAVLIGKDLHLDMLGLHQVLLDEDVAAAEGLFRLAVDQLIGGLDLLGLVAAAHAAAAAAGSGLQDDGEAEADGLFQRVIGVLQRLGAAGDDGHAAFDGDLLGAELVAHLGQHVGGRAHKQDSVILAGTGKVGILRQEAIAGVDGGDAPALGQADDAGDVQVRAQGGLLLAHQVRLVRLGAEQGIGIFVGIDGYGMEAQIVAGPENAHRDLAAVGNQHLFQLCDLLHAILPSAALRGL